MVQIILRFFQTASGSRCTEGSPKIVLQKDHNWKIRLNIRTHFTANVSWIIRGTKGEYLCESNFKIKYRQSRQIITHQHYKNSALAQRSSVWQESFQYLWASLELDEIYAANLWGQDHPWHDVDRFSGDVENLRRKRQEHPLNHWNNEEQKRLFWTYDIKNASIPQHQNLVAVKSNRSHAQKVYQP